MESHGSRMKEGDSMSLRTKTIEELFEMEEELRLSLDEEDGSYRK